MGKLTDWFHSMRHRLPQGPAAPFLNKENQHNQSPAQPLATSDAVNATATDAPHPWKIRGVRSRNVQHYHQDGLPNALECNACAAEIVAPKLFGSRHPRIWLRRCKPEHRLAVRECILNYRTTAWATSLANLKSVLGDQGRG